MRLWALGLAQHRWSFWSGASVEISQLLVPLAEKSFIVHGGSVCALSCFSRVLLCATPWTVAHLVSLSVGFSKQEYWSGLPCTPSGDLPKPGIALESLMSPALASGFFTTRATWEALMVEESSPSPHPSEAQSQCLWGEWACRCPLLTSAWTTSPAGSYPCLLPSHLLPSPSPIQSSCWDQSFCKCPLP